MDDDFDDQDREEQKEKERQDELVRLQNEIELHRTQHKEELKKLDELHRRTMASPETNEAYAEYIS